MRRALVLTVTAVAAAGLYVLAARHGETSAEGRPPTRVAIASAAARAASLAGGRGATPADDAVRREAAAAERPETPPPPFTDGIFPCSSCHNADMPPNRTRRELTGMHEDIVLTHDEEHRWCLDCHDAANRDQLHLASGDPVPFEESYRLCGQCHGEKYRDWRAGIHGRRAGQWNGHKTFLLCAHCHSPHQPRFRALEPKPAPERPRRGDG
ncbi:MAG TPA: hypothetical protein VK886_20665 [Vicinamibacterales bacterium]|nr:hypothetical protein [Vicinamibacterales bacterium]